MSKYFECKEYPDEKIGTKYKYIDDHPAYKDSARKGEIVQLMENDNSTSPWFKTPREVETNNDKNYVAINWKSLERIEENKQTKTFPLRLEMIEAMKETLNSYLDETHEFACVSCHLCTLLGVKGKPDDKCNKCPWVQITGETCKRKDAQTRIKELCEWIQIYKNAKDEPKETIRYIYFDKLENGGLLSSYSSEYNDHTQWDKAIKVTLVGNTITKVEIERG